MRLVFGNSPSMHTQSYRCLMKMVGSLKMANLFPQELEEVLLQSNEGIECDDDSDTSSTNVSDFFEDDSDSDEED